ncbi:unnamed protein product [Somion occarium]|uniref:Acyl-coenzyme A oxidase n=1 Tax=Somion occarium TaxID=3059160 RepID=A0ABP1CRZ2_9APHY
MGPPGCAQNAEDVKLARTRSRIEVSAVRDFLYGGRELWDEHTEIANVVSEDPVFDKAQRPYLIRTERYGNSLKMMNRIQQLREEHHWSSREYSKACSLLDEPVAVDLHDMAFAPVFMAQASQPLLSKYGDLITNHGILGCYLQTELGHGSNVASLETTATYIPDTREFEIHSPTLTSRKWWIGGLARTATHGVVQAQLVLPGGRMIGPHLFFIQLRSLDDHSILPGITLGDIGPKAMDGYTAIDNGFASFDHVRIPKDHMLSKFAQVTDSGQYIQPPHAKMSYGGMVYIRAHRSGWTIARAATVAIRYATVRRQGNRGEDGLERQIITYPSVYNRLLPILSRAYAFILLGHNVGKVFSVMSERLASGDTSVLAEMHTITSGLKALSTNTSTQDVEVARRALGGHGFSTFAGLGRLYANNLPSVTYEGDNFVLDQQVTRAAVKAYKNFVSSKSPSESLLSPSSLYLRLLLKDDTNALTALISWTNPRDLVDLLERRALCLVQHHVEHINDADASADQRVSRAVTESFAAAQVLVFIKELPAALAATDASIITDLLTLYLLTTLESALVDLLSFGLPPGDSSPGRSSADPTSSLRAAIKNLCLKLLPESIGLTDAFGFSDWELDSSLGVYDGRVYESLWDKAQTEPLNKMELPPGYEEHLKVLLRRGQKLAAKNSAKL